MGFYEEEVKRLIRQQWKPDLESIMEDGGKFAAGYALELVAEADTLRAQLKASQADVKLLREALGDVLTSTTKQVGICGALDRATAALAATAPKE